MNAILAALPGREADARRRWTDGLTTLGWRGRTTAQGDGAERLPHFDPASGLAITASARLDGRAVLCESLGISGPARAGLPDGALIGKSYVRWGPACPAHIFGDYAFAIWDAKRSVLFCARDHIGTRPFYYTFAGESFVFASHIDAVLAAPGVSRDLDEAAVATRLTFGARSLGERTCYRAVRRLPPGHALSVERGAVRLHRWWRPEEVPPLPAASDGAYAEECLAIVTEAVRNRVRGARSIGVHLSGGLDSSSVAVLAARELRQKGRPAPPAFSWQPVLGPGPRSVAEADEYGPIEAVSCQEALEVFYLPPKARDVIAFFRHDGMHGMDAGTLINEQIVQITAAGQGVEVLLSGWGGDEGISFYGNGYYPQLLRDGEVGRLWRELRELNRRPLAALVMEAALPLVSRGARRGARRLRRGRWPCRKRVTFIHPDFARRARPLPLGAKPPRAGVRATQLHLLQQGHLSRRVEGWGASGARHGIEYRYPLLDRRVLEFALGLPPEQYRRGRWSRWLMRCALDPVLPPEVTWNSGKGDPARYEALRDAVAEALPAVRQMIEERGAPPGRACYVELPRLLEELDPERWRVGGRLSPIVNALRFLDF